MRRGINPDLGLAILRVVLGIVFIAHGAPKLFGGVGATAQGFATLGVPLSGPAAWFIALLEFFGGIALVAGLLVAPFAILFIIELLLGIVLVHAPNGWYVVGPGAGGVEFSVLIVASLLTLILAGPGLAALDTRRWRETDRIADSE